MPAFHHRRSGPWTRGLALSIALVMETSVALAASPFAGHWMGPWHDEHDQSGVFTLDIDDAGLVKGDVTNGDMRGTVSGRIADSGDLEATYKYGVVPYRATAHLALAGDHLRGTAHYALPLGIPFDSGPIDLGRH